MQRLYLTTFLHFCFLAIAGAQMWNGTDTLYGNEWIDYSQTYYRIDVAEDGIYRIPYETLQAAGLSAEGSRYQLWQLGEEVPLYASSNGPLGPGGFLEFYGRKNRSELDRYLFEDPDNQMLNPWYSLITDTAAYYLSIAEPGRPTLRYEEVENDITNPPAREEWFWMETEEHFTNQLAKVYSRLAGANIFFSHYDGEGFATPDKQDQTIPVACPGVYAAGPDAEIEARLRNRPNTNPDGHALEVYLDEELAAEENFTGSQLKRFSFSKPAATLGEQLAMRVRGLNGGNDHYAIGGVSLRYPRQFGLNGEAFLLLELPAVTGPRYLEMDNLGGNAPAVLLDLSRRQRLLATLSGNQQRALLPAASGERQLVVATAFQTINSLQPTTFTDYRTADAEFLIITHPRLRDDGQGTDRIAEYADYRRSSAGGSYQVAVVDIEQLYGQFAYGRNRHPLAVRNFVNYVLREWNDLQYCFLIGKGRDYQTVRTAGQLQEATAEGYFQLPSFGTPASDNLLLAKPGTRVPVLPVGRLAAVNGGEVKIYLDKVQAMEANRENPQTIEDRAWMKQVVHLGGGGNASEQATIRAYLESMEAEIESNGFGGEVRGFYKNTSDPIQTSLSEQIFNVINEGTSVISFFGHSGSNTFDFNIDNPDNYNNFGKYPLMLSLGCYSGDIFTAGRGIGERFTFYENKASVAFGASKGVGFISSLGSFGRSLYRHLGGDYYGEGVGDVIRATLLDYADNAFIGTATLVEQFTLHGDPAIRLHPRPGPDYTIEPASVQFSPSVVTAQQEDFTLSFDIVNLGRNETDSFAVEIRQQLPNGTTLDVLRDTVMAPAFRSTLKYTIAVPGKEAVGLNTFFIRIDADDAIAELPAPAAESNNELMRSNGQLGATVFIVDNTARPVYPPDFALVGETPITLKASTTDALAPERTYILEIDTTALFDSPLNQRTAIRQRGGVIKWTPTLNWQDSTAYYWRISPDSTEADVGYTWEESSFTYIEGSPEGWGQGHYWQWLEGAGENMKINEARRFEFQKELIGVLIRNKVFNPVDQPGLSYNYDNYASSVRPWRYLNAGLAVVVSHPTTASFWRNPPGANTFEAGDYGLPTGNSRVFVFPTETLDQRMNFISFLRDVVPEGHFIFIFSVLNDEDSNFYPEEWAQDSISTGEDIFSYLESQGATLVRDLEVRGSLPYVFMYQKDGLPYDEKIAEDKTGTAIGEIQLPSGGGFGSYTTPIIGPASLWQSLQWNYSEAEIGLDSFYLTLIGVAADGVNQVIKDSIVNLSCDLSFLNASEFPSMKVQFNSFDGTNLTPVQPSHFHVIFEGLPELSYDLSSNYSFHADTIQQGDVLSLVYGVENIDKQSLDSLLVEYIIHDPANEQLSILRRESPLAGETSAVLSFEADTENFSPGRHGLLVRLNPDNDQAEKTLFNNYFNLPFYVQSDLKNPILQVTFDGQVINDGAIVAPKPEIQIRLEDENPYLLLSDTGMIFISLTFPDGTVKSIPVASEEVEFFPAQEEKNNEARILYRPSFTEDGIYRLSVQGRDASDNRSGQYGYEVEFEVITKNMISNVVNYPNPFSSSTRFVYTLTGQEPAEFKIQILTVSGRIVREFTKAELGGMRIGVNQSDFVWDGTDEYGDRLANGVYLYRVIARDMDGEDYEIYQNGTGRFFQGGFGKLVILR